jgi:Tol biopolymer transport system component
VSPSFDFDRTLADWLDGQAPMHEPDGLTDAVLSRTRRTRQVPGWASLERWFPMTVITRPALSPPLRLAWLVLIGLLMVALVASVAIVGSRLLTSTGPDGGLAATAVIPQGDEAVFAYSFEGDLFTVKADGTELRQATDRQDIASIPIWSPDGTRLAYRIRQGGSESVVVMDGDGREPTIVATDSQALDSCSTWSLAWSPDGTTLTFPTDGCSEGPQLSIVPADGSAPPTRLFAPGMNSKFAAWSPDGTRIAYLGSAGTDRTGLYVAEATPSDALAGELDGRLVAADLGPTLGLETFGTYLTEPRWSPDGSELAVAKATDGLVQTGFLVVRADGSGQRLEVEDAGNPEWSPDGQRFAFHRTVDPSEYVHDRPCTVRTWIVDSDGSEERELAEVGDGCAAPPVWSPDGTRLASVLIVHMPDDPPMIETADSSFSVPFHLGIVTVDGSRPPVVLPDAYGSWQPVAAPLPRAASSLEASTTP